MIGVDGPKRWAIEVYNYPDRPDCAEHCADDAPGAEFELIEFDNEHDEIGETVNVYDTRAEAEARMGELQNRSEPV